MKIRAPKLKNLKKKNIGFGNKGLKPKTKRMSKKVSCEKIRR